LLVLFGVVIVSVFATIEEEDDVMVLTSANFDGALAENDLILVEFYAPWCGHCKTLAPEYAKAAAQLKKADPKVPLAKVDATEHRDLGERFGVKGFPTLKWFRNGKAADYEGGRTASEIVSWISKKSGPAAVTVTSAAQASDLETDNEVAVFGLFATELSEEYQAFMQAAGAVDGVKFAVSTDSSVATKFGVSAPAIVLTKKFDEGRMDYAGPFTNLDITEFVTKGSTPNVIEFSPATAQKIFGGELKTHFLLFVDKSQSYYADKRAMLDTFAVEYKGRLLSVIIPSTEDKVMQYFGFEVRPVT
jgi:protein disulfide-isomerase A1